MSAWMWREQGQTGKPSFENKKKHLWKRCCGKCEYCGKNLIRVTAPCAPLPHNSATIDHRNPQSKGGKNEISNLAMVCLTYNQAKADMGFEEFMSYLEKQERLRGEHHARIKKDALKDVNTKQLPEFIVADTVNYILARFDLVEKQRRKVDE